MAGAESPKLRFTCFLLREGTPVGEEVLRPEYRPGGIYEMEIVESGVGVPAGAVAYLGSTEGSVPEWAEKLVSAFPALGGIRTTSHRLVLLIPVGDRVFAATFGYGATAIRGSLIVSNFGLSYAARVMRTDGLREFDSRRMDASARSQKVQISQEGGVSELDVSPDGEFVHKLVGRLEEAVDGLDVQGTVVAGDSLSFSADVDLASLVIKLEGVLKVLEKRSAKHAFAFVDALSPVARNDERAPGFDRILVNALNRTLAGLRAAGSSTGTHSLLTFAPPEGLLDTNLDHIFVQRGSSEEPVEGFSTHAFLQSVAGPRAKLSVSSLDNVKIVVRSDDLADVVARTRLREWLVLEATHGPERLIHTRGRWWLLDSQYAATLDEDLSQIPDVTKDLALPHWSANLAREEHYVAACQGDDYVVMDQVDLRSDGDEVEACDLFDLSGRLIHVKKFTGSQTLSHLFAQGMVSVDRLRLDANYKHQFVAAVGARSEAHVPMAGNAPQHVVYAIAAEYSRDIPSGLPTFSKVNLREFHRRLTLMAVSVSTAKIVLTT